MARIISSFRFCSSPPSNSPAKCSHASASAIKLRTFFGTVSPANNGKAQISQTPDKTSFFNMRSPTFHCWTSEACRCPGHRIFHAKCGAHQDKVPMHSGSRRAHNFDLAAVSVCNVDIPFPGNRHIDRQAKIVLGFERWPDAKPTNTQRHGALPGRPTRRRCLAVYPFDVHTRHGWHLRSIASFVGDTPRPVHELGPLDWPVGRIDRDLHANGPHCGDEVVDGMPERTAEIPRVDASGKSPGPSCPTGFLGTVETDRCCNGG